MKSKLKKRHSDFYHLFIMGRSSRSLSALRAREAHEDFVDKYGEEYVQDFDELVREAYQKSSSAMQQVRMKRR